MEPTTLPPLVSDEKIMPRSVTAYHYQKDDMGRPTGDYPRKGPVVIPGFSAKDVRDLYEADRAKTREVVQALVDYIAFRNSATAHPVVYYANGGKSYAQCLALAKSTLNIKPKQ